MGSLIVVLIAVAIHCREAYCNTFTTVANLEDTGFAERNNSRAIEKGGSSGGILWKNLGPLLRKSTRTEESRGLIKSEIMNNETNNRKSRLLGSLAFLAGLSFGGLATAASSTVKTIAKLPQAGFTLNLGSSKNSPYIAAYYNPYSLLPYPIFYHGPYGFAPIIDPAKLQTTSHNDLTPQVISVFDKGQPIDLTGGNEEYVDEEKKSGNDKSASNGEDEADHRVELRAEADRNAEEKTTIRGCKEGHKKHGNAYKGSAREREDLQMDADDPRATLNFRARNTTAAEVNQTVTENTTMTTGPPGITIPTQNPIRVSNHTVYPHPSYPYYGGRPQDISHVDLTTGSNHAHHYHDHGQINYNLPYERPANFYHDDKYDVYSNPHTNPYFSGSFPGPDQINEYSATDFNRLYPSEYKSPYINGFRPVK